MACLQSGPGGTDPCSVLARRGPPWPRALEASTSPGSPPGSRSSPLPAPRPPTGALTHSAPTSSPSPASPVPLTPLDAVLSVMPGPGAERGGGRAVSPTSGTAGPLRSAPGSQCHAGAVVGRPGPRQPPCCRNLSGARTCSRRSLGVTSFCGSPRALLLPARSPALEDLARALGGPRRSRSVPSTK